MDPIVLFLKEDILPAENSVVNKVRRKASWFWLSDDQKLYKCSFSGSYLLCIHPETLELLLSYMKGFVEAIQEANPYLTKPLPRDIGGRIRKRKHKNI